VALKIIKGIREEPEHPSRQKSREEYLVACLRKEAADSKFTDWERKFITSLVRQVSQGRKLSAKQREILERIWEK
jgi:hypothetical protein